MKLKYIVLFIFCFAVGLISSRRSATETEHQSVFVTAGKVVIFESDSPIDYISYGKLDKIGESAEESQELRNRYGLIATQNIHGHKTFTLRTETTNNANYLTVYLLNGNHHKYFIYKTSNDENGDLFKERINIAESPIIESKHIN